MDPFGGSGTTLAVAKKLSRNWIGFELSKDYACRIQSRLDQTKIGAPLDGSDDPIESAPATKKGKQRPNNGFDQKSIDALVESYKLAGEGFPAEYILCDKDLDHRFIDECLKRGIGGNAIVWNRLLLTLRKTGKLPKSTRQSPFVSARELNRYSYSAEVASRLVSDEFSSEREPFSIHDVLCCPDSADFFDEIARQYGPRDIEVTSLQYRLAALSIRESAERARNVASQTHANWTEKQFSPFGPGDAGLFRADFAGVFLIKSHDVGIYSGDADNLDEHLARMLANPEWQRFEPAHILIQESDEETRQNYSLKSTIVRHFRPLLNAKDWYASPTSN